MKDLLQSVKDAYSVDEQSPSEASWKAIDTRMRRASSVKWTAMTAAAVAACSAAVILLMSGPGEIPETTAEVPRTVVSAEPASPEPQEETPSAEAYRTGSVKEKEQEKAKEQVQVNEKKQVNVNEKVRTIETPPQATAKVPATEEKEPENNGTYIAVNPQEKAISSDATFQESVPKKKSRLSIGVNLASSATNAHSISYTRMPQLPFLALVRSDMMLNRSNSLSYVDNYCSERTSVSYSHDLPLSVGLTASLSLSKRLSIESGIEYSYLHSVEDNHGVFAEQSLHFIGIPMRMSYSFLMRGGFSLYAGAGATVEKCIFADIGGTRFPERRLQWSGEAFAGAEYRIWKKTGLYFQPALSYSFTETDFITYRTENPLTLSLSAGLRFHLL